MDLNDAAGVMGSLYSKMIAEQLNSTAPLVNWERPIGPPKPRFTWRDERPEHGPKLSDAYGNAPAAPAIVVDADGVLWRPVEVKVSGYEYDIEYAGTYNEVPDHWDRRYFTFERVLTGD